MYISLSDSCTNPTPKCSSILRGSENNPITLRKSGKFPSSIYVGITAFRHATYTITPKV